MKRYRQTYEPEAFQITYENARFMGDLFSEQNEVAWQENKKRLAVYGGVFEIPVSVCFEHDCCEAEGCLFIKFKEGDWIIKSKSGYYYPMSNKEFRETYEEVIE